MLTDLDEAGLQEYRSTAAEPADFDARWRATLEEARALPIDVRLRRVDTGLTTVEHFDLTFAGFGGEPVHGWYVRPVGHDEPLATVVQYIGYGGGRGAALENLLWASAGFAHVVMDNRGQGSTHRAGSTADPHGSGPAYPGFMTRGVESFEEHYFRRLMTDAVRVVEAASAIDGVDADNIGIVGGSQGGALALAASAFAPGVRAMACFVPFLCDIRRASLITDQDPYKEIGRFLETHRDAEERTFSTLSYFDGVHLAKRAVAPALFTTSLMDPVCPPSTVHAAVREYGGPSSLHLWRYNGHVGGGIEDERMAIDFLREHLRAHE
jgi:cephalosporin-C deacetylase